MEGTQLHECSASSARVYRRTADEFSKQQETKNSETITLAQRLSLFFFRVRNLKDPVRSEPHSWERLSETRPAQNLNTTGSGVNYFESPIRVSDSTRVRDDSPPAAPLAAALCAPHPFRARCRSVRSLRYAIRRLTNVASIKRFHFVSRNCTKKRNTSAYQRGGITGI